MNNFLEMIARPTVWIVSVIELLLLAYLVYKFVKTKSLFILMTAIVTFGLFYDAFIISLGTITSASNMLVLSKIRFVLHGGLVPLLFVISEQSIKMKKPLAITFYVVAAAFVILGIVNSFLAKYEVMELAGISRLVVNKEATKKIVQKIPVVLNIIAIIPLIVIGIIEIVKEKNVYLLLSGAFMFFFSAIGPIVKAYDYLFLLSMFGEVLMIVFAILFFIKKEKNKPEIQND